MVAKQSELSTDLTQKIHELASNNTMDPTIAAIIQSVALIASNSSVAQLETAKYHSTLAEATKKAELREVQKAQKKEEAKHSSGWEKLDETLQTTILTASSDGVSIPDKPSHSFTKMVQAKTGTVIRLRLKQKFHDGMMDADIGLCTALSRGLILSMPSPHAINNLSPFFTPPDGVETFSTKDLLKIDVQYHVGNGLEEKDVRKLTKQHKSIPNNAIDLTQQIQNF
jgi:hypothetical protein